MATKHKLSLLSQNFTFDSRLHWCLPCNVYIDDCSQNLLATATTYGVEPAMLNGSASMNRVYQNSAARAAINLSD